MHHRGRIHDAAVVAISESRDVALTHVLDDFEEVSLDVELGAFAGGIGNTQGSAGTAFGLCRQAGSSRLALVSSTVGFGFQEFVSEHPIAPAAIVVQQGQRTDGLVEHVQVAGIKQQTLSGDEGFASHLEGGRLCGIAGIGGTGVLAQSDEHFVLHDVACGSRSQGLVGGPLTGLLGTRLAPEAVTIQLHGLAGLLEKSWTTTGSTAISMM